VKWQDKVVLITGAAMGIGAATARAFAQAGADRAQVDALMQRAVEKFGRIPNVSVLPRRC
jgi:NADP-dependent 3-hydroxy acid dehydrogenase YdfG